MSSSFTWFAIFFLLAFGMWTNGFIQDMKSGKVEKSLSYFMPLVIIVLVDMVVMVFALFQFDFRVSLVVVGFGVLLLGFSFWRLRTM